MNARIHPAPTAEEAAAMVAAVEALWPRTVVAAESTALRRTSWRFSGRWWSPPIVARRNRPW